MSIKNNSSKSLPKSSNSCQKRISSLNRSEKPSFEPSPSHRTSSTPTSVANRLIQKRASTNRKLEILRQKKLEAEMKEVQSKPTILNKSRKLAKKVEKKLFSEGILLGSAEEVPEKLKTKSLSHNRISSYKSPVKNPLLKKENEYGIQNIYNKPQHTINTQKISKSKPELFKNISELSPAKCNDTFELEAELGLIETRLGITKNPIPAVPDPKSFVFAPSTRVSQRVNFKHQFHIREIS